MSTMLCFVCVCGCTCGNNLMLFKYLKVSFEHFSLTGSETSVIYLNVQKFSRAYNYVTNDVLGSMIHQPYCFPPRVTIILHRLDWGFCQRKHSERISRKEQKDACKAPAKLHELRRDMVCICLATPMRKQRCCVLEPTMEPGHITLWWNIKHKQCHMHHFVDMSRTENKESQLAMLVAEK